MRRVINLRTNKSRLVATAFGAEDTFPPFERNIHLLFLILDFSGLGFISTQSRPERPRGTPSFGPGLPRSTLSSAPLGKELRGSQKSPGKIGDTPGPPPITLGDPPSPAREDCLTPTPLTPVPNTEAGRASVRIQGLAERRTPKRRASPGVASAAEGGEGTGLGSSPTSRTGPPGRPKGGPRNPAKRRQISPLGKKGDPLPTFSSNSGCCSPNEEQNLVLREVQKARRGRSGMQGQIYTCPHHLKPPEMTLGADLSGSHQVPGWCFRGHEAEGYRGPIVSE
ncbi:uncharacterized protein [Dipodomys merriami]|uniref:uncharacterized protein n=1 Tax=Dipodomys merriami TaxID=94247 RepID=UPI003855A037